MLLYRRPAQTNYPMTVPGPDQIRQAVGVLRNGGVIAMPSDTLYALCAAASDAAAVRRVFEVKGRQEGRPLPLFVHDLPMAERLGVFDERARRLARAFWPGQLTIVVKKRPEYESEALAGGETVGVRVPDNAIALTVLQDLGDALTGTSANLTGGPDPVSADEVQRQLGERLDMILDAGPAAIGVASTIVDCSGLEPRILRAGAVSEQGIAAALHE
jgi:L-threonylcarbamoyladenylate synthase